MAVGPVSICYECWKHEALATNRWEIENHKRYNDDRGIHLERVARACQGCGEPISIPRDQFRGTWRWFSHGVCSMRCYQRAYRKRRREHGRGSAIDWKVKDGHDHNSQCATCKKRLQSQRKDARYCSNACRQFAYRAWQRPGPAE
jgi:hypothetical protein